MFLQDTTPDTSGYMIAGYVIFFVLLVIYLASLFIRSRNLYADLKILEGMDEKNNIQAEKLQTAGTQPVSAVKSKAPPVKRKTAKTRAGKSTPVRKKTAKRK
jgi:hypothetical protein